MNGSCKEECRYSVWGVSYRCMEEQRYARRRGQQVLCLREHYRCGKIGIYCRGGGEAHFTDTEPGQVWVPTSALGDLGD